MELLSIVFEQVVLMLSLMMAGWIAYHKKLVKDEGIQQISNVLLYIVTPLTIINAYQIPFDVYKLQELGITLCLALIAMVFMIIITKLCFPTLDGIGQFGLCFPNCGFMGIPLIKAILGDEAVFYLSAYMVIFNLLAWTYGIYMVTRDRQYLSLKKGLLNPGTISVILGLVLFISPIKIPPLLFRGMESLANMNTPLAMIILGCYIAKMPWKKLLLNIKIYQLSLLRLVIFPLCIGILLMIVPEKYHIIKMTVYIASCAPAAVNTMIFAIQFQGNKDMGASFVSLSSLLSLLSMPLIISLSSWLWS